MNERYRLLRKSAIENPGSHTSIRQLPLDKAYPSLHDTEAQSDFYKRLNEFEIEIGLETNTGIPRNRIVHIMYLDHAICRKSNNATYCYSKLILEYKIKIITVKKFKEYRYRGCMKCWERFLKYQEIRSGLFHGYPKDISFENMFY